MRRSGCGVAGAFIRMAVVAVGAGLACAASNPHPSCLRSGARADSYHVQFRRRHELIEFDPLPGFFGTGRSDVELAIWAQAGALPTSQTLPKTWSPRWDPQVRDSWLADHFTRGYPTPQSQIRTAEAIAHRNAWELAEYLGYDAPVDQWPRDDEYEYKPHANFSFASNTPDTCVLHIDEMPTSGNFVRADPGNRILIINPTSDVDNPD